MKMLNASIFSFIISNLVMKGILHFHVTTATDICIKEVIDYYCYYYYYYYYHYYYYYYYYIIIIIIIIVIVIIIIIIIITIFITIMIPQH